MSMTDPIADLCTRIRNAMMRHYPTITIPYSKIKQQILKVLEEEGFIEKWERQDNEQFPSLVATLKYTPNGDSMIRKIKRISKPGLRVYSGNKDLRPILYGQGIAVITTSQGVLSDKQCRLQKIGGEVLCYVW